MGNIKVNSDSSSQDQATALDPKGARTLHTDKLFVHCIKKSCQLGLLSIFFSDGSLNLMATVEI